MVAGQRLKEARKKANLTQVELANIIGVKAAEISQYESNKRTPRWPAFNKLLDALNITADDVIFKNQSLIVDTSNFVINGDNGHNNDVNITGKTINLKASGNAVLEILYDDIMFKGQSLIVDTSNFIVNGANNKDIDITTGIGYIKLSSDNSINLSVNNSTLTVTSSDVTFKGQSLINNGGGVSGGNYVVNGLNNDVVNIITGSGNNINLSVDNSTLAITRDDVTFNDQSLIIDPSMFIVNGTNNSAVNIDVVGNNGINMKTYNDGDGGYGINLTVGSSTLAITDTGVTFKGQSLILNGQNNGEVNINTNDNYINIKADSEQHGSYGINLTAGSSTLAIIDTDVMFKGQSLIVDTSNFIINDYEKELSFTDGTISTGGWYSVCYGNGMFVTVTSNKCAWSTDGKTFTDGTISAALWNGVCYGNGMFVAVTSSKCAWSTDGKTFTDGTISTGEWYGVCYGNGMFVAVTSSKCAWSTDGKTFTDGTIGAGGWYGVCYGNGMFVTVSNNSKCAWSEFRIVTAKSFVLKDQTYTKTESDDKFVINGTSDKNIDLNGFRTFQVSTYNSIDLTCDSNSININQSSIVISGNSLAIKIPSNTVNNTIRLNNDSFDSDSMNSIITSLTTAYDWCLIDQEYLADILYRMSFV